MASLKQDIESIVAGFTHELFSRIQLASAKEQATVLGGEPLTEEKILEWVDAYYKKYGEWPTSSTNRPVIASDDNRGKWWGKLTASQRSLVGQKAAATRRRNSKRTSRKAA